MPIPFLLIDQDDTLNDLSGKVHSKFKSEYGLDIPEFQLRDFYNMENTVPNITPEIVQEVFHQEALFAGLEPNPGAVEALHEMDRMGLNVRIVTKPIFTNFTCVPDKKRWVVEHLGTKWLPRMVFTEDKTIVMGRYLIDDKPVIKGDNENPVWERIVYHQPYNVNSPGKRLTHWADWREVVGVESPTTIII